MNTTITVPSAVLFEIAGICARDIHAAVISMHVRLVSAERARASDFDRNRIAAVRGIIRSIADPMERRLFIDSVRYLFRELCKENRTEKRWQTYVLSVREVHPEYVTPEAAAKLEASGFHADARTCANTAAR
jgi:hypothetical protein